MAHQALYRKYRPQRFRELVGQGHVTNALRNAVRDGRVGHAYLFSGPRGTGKTTTARILAKAISCTDLQPDGEPCGVCDHCVAITAGTFLDVFELDAASNRGVEDARVLLERIALRSASGGKKIYILDEAHMLTDPAANTLLKSLEEPPEHVVFVLATTNPERVLPTIRSRTQHFEFKLYPSAVIEEHLSDICAREGVAVEPDALAVIARAGAGSMRDAVTLLDQALAHFPDGLRADEVAGLFGGTPFSVRARVFDAIAAEDPAGALVALDELLEHGHDPRRVAEDLMRAARDAYLLASGAVPTRSDASEEQLARLGELGEVLGVRVLERVLETLGASIVDMRGVDAADPRLVLEIALVRLARRDAAPALDVLAERIDRLERRVGGASEAAGRTAAPAPAAPAGRGAPRETLGALRARQEAAGRVGPPPATAPEPAANGETDADSRSPAAPSAAPATTGAPLDLDDVILAWAAVLPSLSAPARAAVQEAQPVRVDGDAVVFGVPRALKRRAEERFRSEAETIRTALAGQLGRTVMFRIVEADQFSSPAPTPARPARHDAPDAAPAPDDDMDPVDLADLDDASPAISSVDLLARQLDATVVEERPREEGDAK